MKRYEEKKDTCGREDPMLATKEVLLCGYRDTEITKYGCSLNTRSQGRITSLCIKIKSMRLKKIWKHNQLFQNNMILNIAMRVENRDKTKKKKRQIWIFEFLTLLILHHTCFNSNTKPQFFFQNLCNTRR